MKGPKRFEKTLKGWLGFFRVVREMELGELQMEDWMVRVRSLDDLQVILSLALRGKGKVSMLVKEEFRRGVRFT